MWASNIFLWGFFFFSASIFSPLSAKEKKEEVAKKKMIIFSSRGGFGHQKASEELEILFSKNYEVKTVYWYEEAPFKKYDIVRNMTFGMYSGESFYNFLLKKQWMHALRMMVAKGPTFVRANRYGMEEVMVQFLEEERPDMIISVAPIFNLPAMQAAAQLHIPYLLVTLDADLTSWVDGLEFVTHPAFAITIGYEAPKTRPLLRSLGIDDKRVHTIGFPISQKFFESYDKKILRKKWNLRPGVPCIVIMMGGVGTTTAYEYAQKLSGMNIAADVLVCAGQNDSLRARVRQLKSASSHMKIQALSFVEEIYELLFMASFLITKGGGMTLYQAIASKTPLVCHSIGAQLPWDLSNINFITDNKMGIAITQMSTFEEHLLRLLKNDEERVRYKKNMAKLHPIRFHAEVQDIVESLNKEMATFNSQKREVKKIEAIVTIPHVEDESELNWFEKLKKRVVNLFS